MAGLVPAICFFAGAAREGVRAQGGAPDAPLPEAAHVRAALPAPADMAYIGVTDSRR